MACGSLCPDTYQFCGHCGAKRTAEAGGGGEVDDVLRALVGEQLRAELVEHGGRLPEERRLVSALFADLSGFTSLAGRLDPESLAEVVDPILAGLVRIVKRGEGHVGAFAGDALLCYFGAPVAHEDDAARAVRCAHEMLQEFPALLAVAPQEAADLTLRIGVDTGAVMARLVAGDIKTDYNILGNSVNMAQRLQSAAPPGALVVGETTYRLTADQFDYEDIGPLQVKGRAEPLPAYLLLNAKELAGGVHRRTPHSTRVHGRESELAALADAEGPGPVRGLAVVAEAGTGKSRLLQEARGRSAREWHEGGCASHDARAYRPWVGVLDSLGVPKPNDGVRLVRGVDLDADLESLPPAVRRDLVARDVADLLRAAAPAVVVLEDLHWADRPSLDLLDDLLFELGDADLLLVATSREKPDTAADLALLELGPLGEHAVGDLLVDLLGGVPPDDLVADILRRSGGNPLYVTELALGLRDRGLVRRLEGDVLVTTATGLDSALDLVPDTLEGLIGARIDALPAAQERTLTVAAALGQPVDEQLVAAVTAELGESDSEVTPAFAGLRAARLLEDRHFVHALVQSTAYIRTPRARRRRLHLAAAAVGGELVPEDQLPAFLARHLYLAGAGARALVALEAAVEDALTRGAHDEALLHLFREIELRRSGTVEPDRRSALPHRLVAAGELLELLGRYDEAEPVFREAIELGAGAVAYRGLVGCLRRLGRYDDVHTTGTEALALPAIDPMVASLIREERAAAFATVGDLDSALNALGPAPDAVCAARQNLLRAYCMLSRGDDLAAAEKLLCAAVVTLEAAEDWSSAVRALRHLGAVQGGLSQPAAAIATLERGLRLAKLKGVAEEVMFCLGNLDYVAAGAGDYEASVRYARAAMVHSDRIRHAYGRALYRNNLAHSLLGTGDPHEALPHADRALAITGEHGLSGLQGVALETRSRVKLALGDLDGALDDATRSLTILGGSEDEPVVRDLITAIENERSPGS